MIATSAQLAKLPTDPDRRAQQQNLLRARRVARLVCGREPIGRGELVEMVATNFGLSHGAAEAAVDRAADAGQIAVWISLPVKNAEGSDPDDVLGAMQAESDALAKARRGQEPRAP